MKTTREFCPSDRYAYDFGPCTYANGFAQIDTKQDASYFGTWVSPARRMIVNYCEGDVTIHVAETGQELVEGLREIDEWNVAHGYGRARIDPGLNPAFRQEFVALGAGEFLHPEPQPTKEANRENPEADGREP